MPSDPQAVLELLNSLGIAGPNIIHAEQGMWPDGKHSYEDTWDGPGWCVCRRIWPCEALQLSEAVVLMARALAESEERVARLTSDEFGHALHQRFYGGVDSRGHNVGPDGEPWGDCYKCRIVRDFVREYVARAALLEGEPDAR